MAEEQNNLLSEETRILKPNGRLLIRILSGDQAHSDPKLTGSLAPIRFVERNT